MIVKRKNKLCSARWTDICLPLILYSLLTAPSFGATVINKADLRAGYTASNTSENYTTINLYHRLSIYNPSKSLSRFTLNMELFKDAWLNSSKEDEQAFNLSELYLETEKIYDDSLTFKLGRQSLSEGFSPAVYDGLKTTYYISNKWNLTGYAGVSRYDETSTKLNTEYVPTNGFKLQYSNLDDSFSSYLAMQNRVFNVSSDSDSDGEADRNSALLVSQSTSLGKWSGLRAYYHFEGEVERQQVNSSSVGFSSMLTPKLSMDAAFTKQFDTFNYANVSQSVYKNFFNGTITGSKLGFSYVTDNNLKLSSRFARYEAESKILGAYHQAEFDSEKINLDSWLRSVFAGAGTIQSPKEYAHSGYAGFKVQSGSWEWTNKFSGEKYKKLNKIQGLHLALESALAMQVNENFSSQAAVVFEKFDPKEKVKTSFLWFLSYWGNSK